MKETKCSNCGEILKEEKDKYSVTMTRPTKSTTFPLCLGCFRFVGIVVEKFVTN